MDSIDTVAASEADRAERVPVHCFGERGMEHRPDRPRRMPIAAGLFGVPAPLTPPSNDRAPGCGGIMSAA